MKTLILCHIISYCLGILLDILFGDPHGFPHIVVGFGKIISINEKLFYRMKNKKLGGIIFAILNLVICILITGGILTVCYLINIFLYIAVSGFLIYQCLALKSLKDESLKVYKKLVDNDIEGSKNELSMIVGRDTENLSEVGIIKATVETVAENTSDGIVAPLVYISIWGPLGGCIYKMINTMDSMVGYRNEKYMRFGTAGARLDDFFGFIPSRLAAIFMICSAAFLGFDNKSAYRIWKRDRRNHASPNSAQTEAVMAGALNVQLAGDAYYKGVLHKKPFIGDDIRSVEIEDIKKSHRLLYMTSSLLGAVFLLILLMIYFVFI